MTEPTDAELTECYKAANGEDVGKAQPLTTQRIFRAMRAAIAKWGRPAVAGDMPAWQQGFLTTMNQDPYPDLGGWFVQFWEGADVAARVYGNDAETLRRRCAAITAPQPTQAQAWAVPLTDEQIARIARSVLETPVADGVAPAWELAVGIARAIEAAHGIGIKKENGNG